MQADEIFLAAVEKKTPGERAAFVEGACQADVALRAQVEGLLKSHDAAGSFLNQPLFEPTPTADAPAPAERPGTVIGPYKLLQQIGEGGMGVVWMAEQTEPVKRKVALKVIKPGMDSRQVIARFEAERQALAMMDHVNIARVFDGGTIGFSIDDFRFSIGETQGDPSAIENQKSKIENVGRPYFVMELVHGVPITKYCDDNHLSPRERLELFVPVCQAIQHAHQKGIIHRDIKPSNVMVTLYDGKPVPKVIDFGVAKATEQKLTERTLFTQYGTMVGTLEYMSPEQAEMSALGVDTRSDIYSLGVLLYELLTGSTPLTHKRMKEAAYAEILRMIKEEEPPKPSTRLSDSGEALASISANRHTEPAKLTKLVKGELDWIVMKTLEKDRNRRYETANGFAADVQRYLNDEPVQACPPSAGYRFRKFARRNKRVLAMVAVVALAILLAVGTLGWAVRDRDAREQDAARERQARVLAIEAEVNSAIKEAERLQEQGKWPDALSAAKRAEGLLAGGGSDELRERVRQLRKDVEMVLRLEEIRLPAANLDPEKLSTGSPDPWNATVEARNVRYASAFADYGIDVQGLDVEQSAERIRRRAIRLELAAALDDWARVRLLLPETKDKNWKRPLIVARAADPDELRNQVRDALENRDNKRLKELAASPQIMSLRVQTLSLLGGVLQDNSASEKLLRQAQQKYPGDFHINFQLGWTLEWRERSDLDEAIRFYTAALVLRPQNAAVQMHLGRVLQAKGELDDAITYYKKAIELDPKDAQAHGNLGYAMDKQGKLDEAIACYKKAIELDPKYAWAHSSLGVALKKQGKLDEAIACYKKAIELDPKIASAHYNLGVALKKQGKLDEAIACYKKAIELDPKSALAHNNLGGVLCDQKKFDEAIASFKKAIELDPKSAVAHFNLGNALRDQKKRDEAVAAYRKAIELDPKFALAYIGLGLALRAKGHLDEAIACYRKAIELDPKIAAAHLSLGFILYRKKDSDGAIAAYRKAIELDPKNAIAHNNLGAILCDDKKDYDGAIACFQKAIELDPKYAAAHFNLGNALGAQKKLDEAVAAYRKSIELDPKNAAAHNKLGIALASQGKLDEAIASYKNAIELDPKYAAAHNNLAWLLATCPDPKLRGPAQAIALAKKAVALDPKNASYPNTLGVAQYRAGNWKAAITALDMSLDLSKGGDSFDWFFLAMAHWQLGEKNKARMWYDRAVQWMDKNQPKDEELRRFRAEATELLGVEKKKD